MMITTVEVTGKRVLVKNKKDRKHRNCCVEWFYLDKVIVYSNVLKKI